MVLRVRTTGAASGFSLIELSMVILVMAVLLGSLLVPLGKRQRMKEDRQAERYLQQIEKALIGFAVSEGRLPWPDTDIPPDGLENPAPPSPPPCTSCEGLLPWRTIGTTATDPWGRVCRYRVSREFASAAQPGMPPAANRFDLFDRGDVRINARVTQPAMGSAGMFVKDIVLTDDAAAAVVSLGHNGAGGRRLDGSVLDDPPMGSDEHINTDGEDPDPPIPHFYAGPAAATTPYSCRGSASPNCEFDDRVIWLPSAVLVKTILDAGWIP